MESLVDCVGHGRFYLTIDGRSTVGVGCSPLNNDCVVRFVTVRQLLESIATLTWNDGRHARTTRPGCSNREKKRKKRDKKINKQYKYTGRNGSAGLPCCGETGIRLLIAVHSSVNI
jgi:hypothetical protein